MFIIFGCKSRYINEDEGVFVCPQCETLKQYNKKSIQSWFTLFFLPIFPLGKKEDRHIECHQCQRTYYPEVLINNTYNLDGTSVSMKDEEQYEYSNK